MPSQRQIVEKEVHHLLRLVSRSFYPHQCVLILEALMFHSVLFEDDMLKLTCMHKKVFRSFCNKLVEDRLIVAFTQKEETGGIQGQQYRWISRTYYFIHHLEAIDAIKWKVHCLVKQVKDEIGQFNDPQGYVCPTCHSKYSLLDVPSLLSEDKMRFECSVCGDTLIEDNSGLEAQKGQEKLERLMAQLEPIIESLKSIDGMKVEDNNFESSLIKAVPATSASTAGYTVSNRSNSKKKDENDKSNAARRSQATVHVSITADDEELMRERQQREERNEKLRQNALPSWHRESAVGQGSLGVYREDTSETTNGVKLEEESTVKQEESAEIPIKQEFQEQNVTVTKESIQGVKEEKKTASSISEENPKILGSSETESSANNTKSEIKSEVPPSAGISVESANGSSGSGASGGSTTNEELDALTAYYAQLRRRQAEEEEAEEAEDDEEEYEDEDGEDDEFEAFEAAAEEEEQDSQVEEKAENSEVDEGNGDKEEKEEGEEEGPQSKTEDVNDKIDEDKDADKEKEKPVQDSDIDMDEDEIDDAIFDEMEEVSDAE
ncbi:DEKNAAC103708 [Brettanomyces naardenensis]|uniref:DEKNAAC103708 n=1 Tax=Brettanomyces naardenensis TaxID=13370 RepID=A0A448YP27_BRENA|nr:DEKNAAC103708 [Brettanomyces naardenensis]